MRPARAGGYKNYANDGFMLWGGAGKGLKGHRNWRVYFAWRGMADADSPLTGERSGQRHTQCGFNGGNDYPVTVATIEDPAQRLRDEREGIYRTLGVLYYFQHELGVNWSLAEDEGYATPLQPRQDARPRPPPRPRSTRRASAAATLRARMSPASSAWARSSRPISPASRRPSTSPRRSRWAITAWTSTMARRPTPSKPTSTPASAPRGGGPFQIPFEVFLPEKIDGFLPGREEPLPIAARQRRNPAAAQSPCSPARPPAPSPHSP